MEGGVRAPGLPRHLLPPSTPLVPRVSLEGRGGIHPSPVPQHSAPPTAAP